VDVQVFTELVRIVAKSKEGADPDVGTDENRSSGGCCVLQ
jgi:hypothetical protein